MKIIYCRTVPVNNRIMNNCPPSTMVATASWDYGVTEWKISSQISHEL